MRTLHYLVGPRGWIRGLQIWRGRIFAERLNEGGFVIGAAINRGVFINVGKYWGVRIARCCIPQ